ncbi:MAG: energy transducer TonB [Bacteroidetes bacterium]|nr:energy transducer TonB [Bacteroidota bacterium]
MQKTYFALLALFIFISVPAFSQEQDEVYTIVEEMPQFPGGEEALFKFLGSKMKYPNDAKENGISGVVYVKFVISADGVVRDSEIARGVHSLLDEEALRVVRLMPTWKPGTQRGKPVNVQYMLPIRFTLTESKKKK